MSDTSRQGNPLKRFGRETSGAAMVEFAIIAPLLFVLIFGIIDFGRVFFLYNNLTNAAREGARLGAVLQESGGGNIAVIEAAVKSKINADATTINNATYTVTYQTVSGTRTVRVRISNFRFEPVTFLAISSVKQLSATSEFRLEFQP